MGAAEEKMMLFHAAGINMTIMRNQAWAKYSDTCQRNDSDLMEEGK